jgi:drug/metabolite transporter (DMT)-like permease
MPPRLQAFLAVVLWGISFVATKAALREISPVTLIFSRSALGTVLLLVTLAVRRRPLMPPRDAWGPLALMGFVGVAFHQVLQAFGIRLTTAVHAGWIVGLIPIWSAVLAGLFLRERFGTGKVTGLVLGFAGAALVVSRGRVTPDILALPGTRGDLLMLASTLNWAIYTTLGHETIRRIGSLRATAGAMLLGGLMLVPLFLGAGGWREYATLSGMGLAAVLYLGLGASGLGYLFWCGALEKVETSRVAAFLYLEPLVTLVTAMALLREPLGLTTLAGGLAVLAGVALVQRAPTRAVPH